MTDASHDDYGQGDWTFETAVNCAVCPACAFTFDEDHEDVDGDYSCPVCAEIHLTGRVNYLLAVLERISKTSLIHSRGEATATLVAVGLMADDALLEMAKQGVHFGGHNTRDEATT